MDFEYVDQKTVIKPVSASISTFEFTLDLKFSSWDTLVLS